MTNETGKLDTIELEHRDYVLSIEKGMAILRAFGPQHPKLTLAEAARLTGMTRAAARRFLLTLAQLGYLGTDKKTFWLKPKILELGERYLSSQPWWNVAQPVIEEAARRMAESCSLCILDGADIVYVCRVAVNRLISTNLALGSRLPAYPTALGRVLLAQLSPQQLEDALEKTNFQKFTSSTVVQKRKLLQIIQQVRADGHCLVDQELEMGLVGLAVPVRNNGGEYAALGVSVHAGRVSTSAILTKFLPVLRDSAERITRGVKQI